MDGPARQQDDLLHSPAMRRWSITSWLRRLTGKGHRRSASTSPSTEETRTGFLPPAKIGEIAGPARSGMLEMDGVSNNGGRRILISFLLLVLIPAGLNLFYLAAVATPQYVSEIRLVVRSAERNESLKDSVSMLQRFARVSGGSTHQDAEIVLSYLKSRAVIEDIGGKDTLNAIFARPKIDYFSRLSSHESIEDALKYWKKKITASIDVVSGILTVRVRAFSAAEAKELASRIMVSSEKLINEISVRVRRDALDRAVSEVDRAAQSLAAQRKALLDFRNRSGSIDPVADVKSISSMIFLLTMEKIEIESQLASLAGTIDQGSVIERQRRVQIDTLNKKIDELQGTLTSKVSANVISEQIREFEQIKLRNLFAEKIYELSQREYETARADIARQQLFVSPVVTPGLAESATYPKVFLEAILFLVIITMLWGIVVLLVASVLDHAQ